MVGYVRKTRKQLTSRKRTTSLKGQHLLKDLWAKAGLDPRRLTFTNSEQDAGQEQTQKGEDGRELECFSLMELIGWGD